MNEWEKRLRAEGLAPLDCEDRGNTVVSSRGTIRPRDAAARDRMEERAAELEHRRTVAATRPTRYPWHRRALAMYAQGIGCKKIATKLGKPRRSVLKLFAARGLREASEVSLISQCETVILVRMLEAMA